MGQRIVGIYYKRGSRDGHIHSREGEVTSNIQEQAYYDSRQSALWDLVCRGGVLSIVMVRWW